MKAGTLLHWLHLFVSACLYYQETWWISKDSLLRVHEWSILIRRRTGSCKRRPTWVIKELLTELKHGKVYTGWKQEHAAQRAGRDETQEWKLTGVETSKACCWATKPSHLGVLARKRKWQFAAEWVSNPLMKDLERAKSVLILPQSLLARSTLLPCRSACLVGESNTNQTRGWMS